MRETGMWAAVLRWGMRLGGRALLVLLPAFLPAFGGSVVVAAPGPALVAEGARHDMAAPIHVRLALDRLAGVGETVTLTCEVSADQAAPDTRARIELPAQARLVGGELDWQGDLVAGASISFAARIVFDAPGEMTLRAVASQRLDARSSWGDLATLYLTVGARASRAGFTPIPSDRREQKAEFEGVPDGIVLGDDALLRAQSPRDLSLVPAHVALRATSECPAGVIEEEGAEPLCVDAARKADGINVVPAGQLTVTGHWSYQGRDGVNHPARNLLVEVVRGDDNANLAYCFTDLQGAYSCGPFTNPGSVGVRVRLFSWTHLTPDDTLSVVNPDWGSPPSANDAYTVGTGAVVFADGTHDIGSLRPTPGGNAERAYWTVDDLIDVWRYVNFNGGGTTVGSITVEWKIDSTTGNYYIDGSHVYLKGDAPLAQLGSTVKHEYGHNAMWNVFGAYFPPTACGSPHYANVAYDAGCAWTEGWATFLALVTNNTPIYYWANGDSLDFEGPTWGTPNWDTGDWVEGRVAGALWDIFDNQEDNDDLYGGGAFAPFWDLMRSYRIDVFTQWWSHWLGRGYDNGSAGPVMSIYQNTMNYRLFNPPNDDFANRKTVTTMPYSINALNTSSATTQGADPLLSCGYAAFRRQSRSVWYQYTPSANGVYAFDTAGSSYDTVLAIARLNGGALQVLGCNDDYQGSPQARLVRTLYAGQTYFIEIMGYGRYSPGGSLSGVFALRADDLIFSDGFTYAR